MTKIPVMEQYHQAFRDLQYERAGVFDLVRDRFDCTTVLYPGSFIHVTPSFYFPHVVYVDRSPSAQRFFADADGVTRFVQTRKVYRRPSFIRFIAQDYTDPLPLQEAEFDLLLSLYATGIVQFCKRYLKTGGILLSNDQHGDAKKVSLDPEFQLLAVVRRTGDCYHMVEAASDPPAAAVSRAAKKSLKKWGGRIVYEEHAVYYVFKKKRSLDSGLKNGS